MDVAHWQGGDIDWRAAYDSGERFAIVKAMEGREHVDRHFLRNWERLLELDGIMVRGAYHFARNDTVGGHKDGVEEAKDMVDLMRAVGGHGRGSLPITLDFEKYSEQPRREDIAYCEGYVKTIEDGLGRSPMVYTGRNVWRFQTGNWSGLKHLNLWLVNYTAKGADPVKKSQTGPVRLAPCSSLATTFQ